LHSTKQRLPLTTTALLSKTEKPAAVRYRQQLSYTVMLTVDDFATYAHSGSEPALLTMEDDSYGLTTIMFVRA